MNKKIDIRQFYTPIQPTVNQSADGVTYSEILPDSKLQNFIYCYWQLKTTKTLSEQFTYRVVADGCIDIIFELGNPQENAVMGFCKEFKEFPLYNSFHYIGVRFLPSMFPQLFKISAIELSNRVEDLQLIVPRLSQFIANSFSDKLNTQEIKRLFDSFFLKQVSQSKFDNDTRFYGAMEIVLNNFSAIDIEKDLQTGISPRQLRRLFAFYVGGTPKTFGNVVRFQNILKTNPSYENLQKNKTFFDAGYYDQSHFIKEFKKLYGITPSKAFGR